MKNILLAPMLLAIEGADVVPEGILDRLFYGLQVAAIGIGIVFAILAIIMGVLYLFELLFYKLPAKKAGKPVEPKPAPAPKAPAAPVAAASADDDEVVAVISAAIAAYYEQNAPTSKYKIKSFRRI